MPVGPTSCNVQLDMSLEVRGKPQSGDEGLGIAILSRISHGLEPRDRMRSAWEEWTERTSECPLMYRVRKTAEPREGVGR